MSEVVIIGVGQTPVGEHWEKSLRELAVEAIAAARKDAGGAVPQAMYIGNMLAATLSHQANLGALLADYAGLNGIEATTVEAAGASGGAAARMAFLAVTSGLVDTALVVGVEKWTDAVGAEQESALAQMMDSDYEAVHGMTSTSQAALLMQRYLHDYSPPREAFACFPVIAHEQGAGNPNAMYRKAISPESYARADMVSDPLNLFDVAPLADGAAALVLTRSELAPKDLPHPLVRITGSSLVTDTLALHDRPDPLAFYAAAFSIERACRQAGMMPKDADFFELFDAASIYAALSLEAAGLTPRGQGWRMGPVPIATMGGLKARGNPVGATGVYQLVEAALQLRGEAGACQVPNARRGLVQCLGGPASTAVTHVLERM
ncbi:MAG TPA: thiolase domain-containing protein [Anaerolineaceae bacterium]|nr:thiolase domain-containing protein [Anaerolineaceae bacterium]